MKRKNIRSIIGTTLLLIIMLLIVVVIVIPFFYMFLNSFKTPSEYYANVWGFPSKFDFTNYKIALDMTQLLDYAGNTIFVCAAGLALNISLAAMASYAISRIKFKLSDLSYKFFLIGLLVPHVLTLIPLFFVSRIFNLYNTRLILVIAYAVLNLPFAVFTLCTFFKSLPGSLEEAAMIDGANHFQTFFRIMLPLAKSGLITIGIFNFLEMWNDYLLALTLIADESKKTISLAVLRIQSAQGVKAEWGAMFACCIMVIAPIMIFYIIFQKRLVGGLTAGGVKG